MKRVITVVLVLVIGLVAPLQLLAQSGTTAGAQDQKGAAVAGASGGQATESGISGGTVAIGVGVVAAAALAIGLSGSSGGSSGDGGGTATTHHH